MKRRFLIACILAAAYTQTWAAPTDRHQYILRKKYLLLQPNASAPAPIKDVVAQLGGHVDFDLSRWIVVTIPDAALQAIRQHPAVKYLQQVVSGPFVQPTTAAAAHHTTSNSRVAANNGPPWTSGTYKYDGAGNILAIGNDTFTYDALSRLVKATVKGTNETYTYDAFGNLIQKTTGTLTASLQTDTTTNHLTTQTYDAAGNLIGDSTETNSFDPLNMQREKDIPSSLLSELYVYNAADERVGAFECSGPPTSCMGATVNWSLRDEAGKVLRQYEGTYYGGPTGTDPPWAWIEDYVYRDSLLLGAERVPEEGGRRHFHLDHLGTPRLVTGSSGQQLAQHDYYSFGVEVPPSFPDTAAGYDREEPMRFTGHERDFNIATTSENANYNDFMHARATIPQWGRFLSVDAHSADPRVPQSWNRYTYALNNPVNLRDPDGRCPVSVALAAGLVSCYAYDLINMVLGSPLPTGAPPSLDANAYSQREFASGQPFGYGLEEDYATELLLTAPVTGMVMRGAPRTVDLAEPAASEYRDVTVGRSVSNRATNVNAAEAGENLEANGFARSVSKDGNVTKYEKGDLTYAIRGTSKSTGGPTMEVFKNGELVQKIRLDARGGYVFINGELYKFTPRK